MRVHIKKIKTDRPRRLQRLPEKMDYTVDIGYSDILAIVIILLGLRFPVDDIPTKFNGYT